VPVTAASHEHDRHHHGSAQRSQAEADVEHATKSKA